MDGGAPLEGLEDLPGLVGLTEPAPEGGVEEDHVDRLAADAGGELLEVDHYRIGRGRNVDEAAKPPHSLQAVGRILEIVVVEVLDRLADTDAFLDAPHAVRIDAQAR